MMGYSPFTTVLDSELWLEGRVVRVLHQTDSSCKRLVMD